MPAFGKGAGGPYKKKQKARNTLRPFAAEPFPRSYRAVPIRVTTNPDRARLGFSYHRDSGDAAYAARVTCSQRGSPNLRS